MKSRMKKLALNQETLRDLTAQDPSFFGTSPKSNNSCVSICGAPCTPVAGMN
jgi:hypothetical protein